MFASFKRTGAADRRIGVALTSSHVALATVRRPASGRPELERCEWLPRMPGGQLVENLRAAGLARTPTSGVLGHADYQLALIEAPDVLPAELRAAVRWRLKDAIDFHVDDAVVDVFELPAQGRRAQGRMMYAVAARRAAVEAQAAALAGHRGFDVVDVPELCLRNLAAATEAAAGGVALLHLGELTATVVLVRGETLYLARQMDLQATMHFAGGTGVDAGTVALELQRSLDYYESHYDQPPIGEVLVAPAGPRAEGLAVALAEATGLRARALELADVLDVRTPPAEMPGSCAWLAIGAALRVERRTL